MNSQTYAEKWRECLRDIDQYLSDKKGGRWVFDTWFSCVAVDSYDPQQRSFVLQVPSIYVYEYLDKYCAELLKGVLCKNFGQDVRLSYRVRQNAAGAAVDFMRNSIGQRPVVSIPDAETRLRAELQRRFPGGYQWLPAYDRIARWMTDNKGRGLLTMGTSGLGKSVICRDILPVIFEQRIPSVTAQELPTRIDELTKARCVIIDDLGKEPTKRFGQPDRSFYDLCDAAERNGILLIITTNLSTTADYRFADSIEHRYGPEVLSRLRSLVLPILFEGKDMRG